MAVHDNNYGSGGSNHDEFGELPVKRIEKMNGVDVSSKLPHLPGDISIMIWDFFDSYGRKPTKLLYPGPYSYTTSIGRIVANIGYVSLALQQSPNVTQAVLE